VPQQQQPTNNFSDNISKELFPASDLNSNNNTTQPTLLLPSPDSFNNHTILRRARDDAGYSESTYLRESQRAYVDPSKPKVVQTAPKIPEYRQILQRYNAEYLYNIPADDDMHSTASSRHASMKKQFRHNNDIFLKPHVHHYDQQQQQLLLQQQGTGDFNNNVSTINIYASKQQQMQMLNNTGRNNYKDSILLLPFLIIWEFLTRLFKL